MGVCRKCWHDVDFHTVKEPPKSIVEALGNLRGYECTKCDCKIFGELREPDEHDS